MSSDVEHYISFYGYMAIYVLIFLQEVGVPNPVPNELVMLFSGYLTYIKVLSLPFVLLFAITADFTAATLLFVVFYFFGSFILNRKPKWMPISSVKIGTMSAKLSSGGLLTIFVCRLTPFIRGYVSVISGLIKIKPQRYILLTLSTAIIVCSVYIITGRLLGPYWVNVATLTLKIKYIIILAAVGIPLAFLFYNYKKSKKEEVEGEEIIFEQPLKSILKIHMISETAFITKGQGVDTAFIELVALLREKNDVSVVVNDEGFGNLLHSHTYGPYYFWKGRKYKNRRILTVHVIPDSIKGSIPMWKLLLPFAKAYFRMAYSYTDRLIAISPMVEKAINDLGVTTPVTKIYNPIFAEKWERTQENRKRGREILGLEDSETVVLGVGQLQERKGVEDYIDIGEAIPGAKFIWVGGRPMGFFTEGINRINRRIKNAENNICFAGIYDLNDMPAIYAAADIFLFPSYQENCPFAPLEAAASGMPVIFRNLKEYELLLKNPYLKASDTANFISLTLRLITDQSFYNEAVQISAQLIKQFDKDVIRKELIDLYDSVMWEAKQKTN